MNNKIYIILPYKESLDPNKAGAVSLYVTENLNYSKYKKNINIVSSENLREKIFFTNRNYFSIIYSDFYFRNSSASNNLTILHNKIYGQTILI